MLVVSFATWYEKIQATARNGAFVHAMEEHVLGALYRFRVSSPGAEVKLERASETSPVWCGHKHVHRLNKQWFLSR